MTVFDVPAAEVTVTATDCRLADDPLATENDWSYWKEPPVATEPEVPYHDAELGDDCVTVDPEEIVDPELAVNVKLIEEMARVVDHPWTRIVNVLPAAGSDTETI